MSRKTDWAITRAIKKLSIATKINLLVVLLIILATVFLGWVFLGHETRALRNELDERATAIANNLAAISEFPLLVGDGDELKRLVTNVIKEKDIIYASVENRNGAILAYAGKRVAYMKEFRAVVVTQPVTKEDMELDIIDTTKKIGKEKAIGAVKLGISLANLERKTIQLKKSFFFSSPLSFCFPFQAPYWAFVT